MESNKTSSFAKLGKFITKRKKTIILTWVVLLALVAPFILNEGSLISLQLGSSKDQSLESVKASDIISSQFSSTVANDSIAIVISASNVSSPQTRAFIDTVVSRISGNSSLSAVVNITSVYSILDSLLNQTNHGVYMVIDNLNLTCNLLYGVPQAYMTIWSTAYNQSLDSLAFGINQTNQGVYAAIDNANLTSSLLYGVPTAYSTIWSTAYNLTRDSLVSGLNQTNQGVYSAIDNANMTIGLLYGVPATYLNVWSQTYAQTQSIPMSNQIAYNQSATVLSQTDPVSFALYTSPLLDAFNASWVMSFQDPTTAQFTPVQRASAVATQTNQLYINNYLGSNATAQAFATALTSSFSLQDFLTNTPAQSSAEIQAFAIQYVTNSSGSSKQFVTAAFTLGKSPSMSDANALAQNIIWNPQTFSMGQNFLDTFNQAAYSQSAAVLSQADPASFTQYTSHLLDLFNSAWIQTLQNASMQQYTPFQRASLASNQANQQYISTFLAANETMRSFTAALVNAFSFRDFSIDTQAQSDAKLRDFALTYVSNASDASNTFVSAAYNLGKNYSYHSVQALAESIIWNPQTYIMGQDFIGTFNTVAYNQTAVILSQADPGAFDQYTSHLLDLFNVSWSQTFLSSEGQNYTPEQRATLASDEATSQFTSTYMKDDGGFSSAVAETFSLHDFLNNITQQSAPFRNFAVNYVSNSSSLSVSLVNATYDLGRNCSQAALGDLAGNVVASPQAYQANEQLKSLISTFVSPSSDVTLVSLSLSKSSNQNLLYIRDILKSSLAMNPNGAFSALVTGEDALNYDFSKSTEQDLSIILPVTIILLLVATGLYFRSVVTPLITLGSIGIGLGISQIFIVFVGTYINKADFMIPTVLVTVLIGVGTDYGIFLVARHREERVRRLSVFDAITRSVTWAGESIATSGTTVIISFLGLAATSIILLQTLGIIVGLGVIVALLVALTFVPAIVVLFGDRVFWPNSGERFKKYAAKANQSLREKRGYFARSGAFSVKRAKLLILLAVLVTLPALYVYATTTPTYNFLQGAPSSLDSIKASNTLTASFGGGRLNPTYVVVTFSQPFIHDYSFDLTEMSTLDSITSHLANHADVQEVIGPTMPYGVPFSYSTLNFTSDSSDLTAVLQNVGADNKTALITLKFSVDPYSTEAINDAQSIRDALHQTYNDSSGVTGIYIGGATGAILDTKDLFVNQFNTVLPIVAIGVAIVLLIVLRSLVLPVFAIVSVFMSIIWTLAVTALVFQAAFSYSLMFMTPLILFVLLLGIGMDYNIFILTRIREEAAKGQKLNEAIIHAIEQTGSIITAAAIILAGSLGALMLSGNLLLKEMGFAFSFSILIDALVVRTYLVPAVMSTLGKWNWYSPLSQRRKEEDA